MNILQLKCLATWACYVNNDRWRHVFFLAIPLYSMCNKEAKNTFKISLWSLYWAYYFLFTWHAVLYLAVRENSDKDLFVGVALGVVHEADVTTCVHELGGRAEPQRCVVDPIGIFHL